MTPSTRRISGIVGLVTAALAAGWGVYALFDSRGDVSEDPPLAQPPGEQRHAPEFLGIADRLTAGANPFLGTQQVRDISRVLDRDDLTLEQRIDANARMCREQLRLGDTTKAIEHIDRAIELAAAEPRFRGMMAPLYQWQGLAYLRRAEVENCIQRHNAECCIFPLAGGALHTKVEPAEKAKQAYLAYLEAEPDDLTVRWLLNLVCMATGDHPDGVPPRFVIPPEAFESDADIARFVDIAPGLGLDTFNLCGGVIVDDFDRDGFLDIVTSTYDPHGPLSYYRNTGDGSFEDRSTASRLDDQLGGLNCLGGDYDNDGDVDILVLHGAWMADDGRIRNSLLRNDGDGTFVDVTRAAGLGAQAYPTQAACWGDFDNDGDLDLYVGHESAVEVPRPHLDFPAQLFSNNGDGSFTDVAQEAGVTNDRFCKGVAAGDYDNDGDLDLYVSNNSVNGNRLYRNNGDGTFTDVAGRLGLHGPMRSFATWFFDYDNDGWLDLFVAAYQATPGDIAADYLGQPHRGVAPCLFRNNGDGSFTDVASRSNLDHPYLPMGANFGDLDNDGFLDIYLTTGEPSFRTLTPNVMLRNDGGRRFLDVTTSGGFGHLQKGHGVAFADLDNDGDQDIYHQLGGFYPGDKYHNALFENPGNENRFLFVELEGTTSNRRGLGARIRVTVSTSGGPRTFHRAVGCGSSFGGSPLRQEIGLGDATVIESVEVEWPTSGTTQHVTDVHLDSMIRIVEGTDGFIPVPLERIEFRATTDE